jgi:hypothetical protein
MMSGKSCTPEAGTNGFELLMRQLQPWGDWVGAALKHFDPAENPLLSQPGLPQSHQCIDYPPNDYTTIPYSSDLAVIR